MTGDELAAQMLGLLRIEPGQGSLKALAEKLEISYVSARRLAAPGTRHEPLAAARWLVAAGGRVEVWAGGVRLQRGSAIDAAEAVLRENADPQEAVQEALDELWDRKQTPSKQAVERVLRLRAKISAHDRIVDAACALDAAAALVELERGAPELLQMLEPKT